MTMIDVLLSMLGAIGAVVIFYSLWVGLSSLRSEDVDDLSSVDYPNYDDLDDPDFDDPEWNERRWCPICGGDGMEDDSSPCPDCDGTGTNPVYW